MEVSIYTIWYCAFRRVLCVVSFVFLQLIIGDKPAFQHSCKGLDYWKFTLNEGQDVQIQRTDHEHADGTMSTKSKVFLIFSYQARWAHDGRLCIRYPLIQVDISSEILKTVHAVHCPFPGRNSPCCG